jgi:membrane protease YdiL (CAAX protease family)
MKITDQLFSGFSQVAVAIGLSLLVFCIRWLFFRKSRRNENFFQFIGINSVKNIDTIFLLLLFAMCAFGVLSTAIGFAFSPTFKEMLMSDNSPYGKILNVELGFPGILSALIYCFINAALAEEILFRGLIARRFFSIFGFAKGNIFQALIFWLMHLIIFRLMTGQWVSFLQLFGFITSFSMGLISGYANYRKHGESIAPSWVLHGCANFCTFLTLLYIWPK